MGDVMYRLGRLEEQYDELKGKVEVLTDAEIERGKQDIRIESKIDSVLQSVTDHIGLHEKGSANKMSYTLLGIAIFTMLTGFIGTYFSSRANYEQTKSLINDVRVERGLDNAETN